MSYITYSQCTELPVSDYMEKNDIIALINLGMSQRQIAASLGVSQSTVKHYLKTFNLKTLRSSKPVEKKDQDSYKRACIASQALRRRFRKQSLIDLKGGKCELCGYCKSHRALNFHHRDPSIKSFALDVRNIGSKPMKVLLEELEKCDLLCANCHMELHDSSLGGE